MFKGADKPILGNTLDAGHFHGMDGMGDAPDPNAPSLDLVQKESAVSAIIRIANENPGEVKVVTCFSLSVIVLKVFKSECTPQVSLVATAPLTNLALAVRMDPSLPSKLKGLYIMGGNTDCRFKVICSLSCMLSSFYHLCLCSSRAQSVISVFYVMFSFSSRKHHSVL